MRFAFRAVSLPALVAVLCCVSAGVCGAAEAPVAAAPVPAAVLACSGVKKNSERLACYDQAVDHLLSGTGDTAAAPAAAVESMFGARAVQPVRAEAAEREEIASLTARVAALRRDGEGMSIVELDNGQTWRQTDGTTALLLKVGDEVTISRAALGSFRMSTPSGRAARVRRMRRPGSPALRPTRSGPAPSAETSS